MTQSFLITLTTLALSIPFNSMGQTEKTDSLNTSKHIQFQYKSLIIPTTLMAYGFWGNDNGMLKIVNGEVKEEVNEHIDKKVTIDDFSQYTPALSVYGLNLFGIKGRNDFKNRTLILATSYILMSTTTTAIKNIAKIERPDGSARNSFPSGHTATAFMGAEFLWQEYKDVSIWYGLAGYAVAAGTGAFRMYNNRHWLTDVATGAGIGMLSTKAAYWSQPFLSRKIFKNPASGTATGIIYPFVSKRSVGMRLAMRF